MPKEMRSCKARLQELRKEFEISKKDYGKPPKVKGALPVLHLKADKKAKKAEKKQAKIQYYRLVNWYLNEYLRPQYKAEIYDQFDSFKEMCAYVYDQAVDYLQNCTYDPDDRMSWKEWAKQYARELESRDRTTKNYTVYGADPNAPGSPVTYIDKGVEIPDHYWKAFGEYCKQHPLKNAGDILRRRKKFIRKMNKGYKKCHRMNISSPMWMYSGLKIDKSTMVKNLKKVLKQNLKRTQQIQGELDKMWKHCEVSPEFRKKFKHHTEDVRKESERRLKQMLKDLDLNPNALPAEPLFYS